jgi:hypothetical protein
MDGPVSLLRRDKQTRDRLLPVFWMVTATVAVMIDM